MGEVCNIEYLNFIETTLIPQANECLYTFYQKYCDGVNINIETKSDNSPASLADRETEKILRDLIMKQYPDHGIWGEEFGAYKIDNDTIWILDPLDGTLEFLAKKPSCFGILIGLLHQGKAIAGAIADPINNSVFLSNQPPITEQIKSTMLSDSIVACTNPDSMFESCFVQALKDNVKTITLALNCMGFTSVIKGSVDAIIENRLRLHDIAPVLPVLINAGITVLDLEGNNYTNIRFDVSQAATQKYGVIATRSPDLANQIVSLYQENT